MGKPLIEVKADRATIEPKVIAFVRANPGCSTETLMRHLTGHDKCPPCCEGWQVRPIQTLVVTMVNYYIQIGMDWGLTVIEESADNIRA